MYIADLDLCRYHSGPFDADNWSVPLLAVGWLDRDHTYIQGPTASSLIDKFDELVKQAQQTYSQFRFRGLYECTLGSAPEAMSCIKGSCNNVFVPGEGVVYVAPAGASHYMKVHSYNPPQPFTDSVLKCPEVGSKEYELTLLRANAGKPLPIGF